jgi:hypothetical protein
MIDSARIWRAVLFAGAFLYAATFLVVFKGYIYPMAGYGAFFSLVPRSALWLGAALLLALVPLFFYRGFIRVSSHISMLVYIVCYVPTTVTLTLTMKQGVVEIAVLLTVFTAGMSVLFLADRLDVPALARPPRKRIPLTVLHAIALAATLVVFWAYAGHLRFVSFENVYAQRFAARDLHVPAIVGYVVMGLAACVYPLYFSLGLVRKKALYAVFALGGHVLIYMCTAAKLSLLTPLILAGTYGAIRIGKKNIFAALLICLVALSSVVLVALPKGRDVGKWTQSIYFTRILGNSAWANAFYYDYFPGHKFTYYTHINVVKKITKAYPYGSLELGQVIGKAYFGTEDINFNANFWASDGIAAAGVPGLLAISVVVALFFGFMNSMLRGVPLELAALCSTSLAMSLINIPFFTSLLSGGGLLMVVLLRYVRLDGSRAPKTAVPALEPAGPAAI